MSTALKGLGASDVNCDLADSSCNFKVPADLDIEAKLTEIASAKNKLKGWSKVE